MSASLRLRLGVVAAGLSFLLLSYAIAQQGTVVNNNPADAIAPGQTDRAAIQQADPSTAPGYVRSTGEVNQNRTNYRAAQVAAGGQHQVVDHFLAACLLGQNKAEVELSQIALQKSENAEVKQFAQKMIQDHQKLIDQLQPLAMMQGGANRGVSSILGGNSESQGTSETTEGRSSDTTALPGSSGASQTLAPTGRSATASSANATTEITASPNVTTTAAVGSPVHQLMQINRQINERCLQMAKEELQQKSGAEFDKCYVGNAIGMHGHALAALEVIGKQTQGTLAQVAQQAQPTVQQHFDSAKQLMKQLEGQSSATGTQAQREANRTE
jgi:predicted outer membrane protein